MIEKITIRLMLYKLLAKKQKFVIRIISSVCIIISKYEKIVQWDLRSQNIKQLTTSEKQNHKTLLKTF